MSDLLAKWLLHYDPIHRGWSPRGIANGVCATNGFSFPRVAGGFNLYRRSATSEGEGTDLLVGASGANQSRVETFSWRPAAGSACYAFTVRSIGGGGVESRAGARSAAVAFDETGAPEEMKPNAPTGLAALQLSGGRFEITWRYVPRGQEAPPVLFHVYSAPDHGEDVFSSLIGMVSHAPRRRLFRFVTRDYPHGTVRRFGVRALTATGATDGNSRTVEMWANAKGPPAHDSIFAETIDEGDG